MQYNIYMNKFLVLIIIFFSQYLWSQNLKFGYPKEVESNDVILLNMFRHRDGRFIDESEINELSTFLNKNNDKKFKIRIHIFGGASRGTISYTKSLSNNLNKKLAELNNIIEIENCGDKYPLFCVEKTDFKRRNNNRIEIICL